MTNARPTTIPAYDCPPHNRRVLLARRPAGIPQPDDFAIDAAPVPEPPADGFLVRNLYLSADPAQRGWASDVGNYSSPVPLGTPMRALAVGVVLRSNDAEVQEGEFLYGWFGWQDYAAVTRQAILTRATLPVPLSAYAGLLGINGLTAYLALMELGRPRAGDTLLVSTAAGAVGSLVGQIGKRLGCRTVGLAGSAEKMALCRDRFGYDAALNYRDEDFGGQLDSALPDGADIFFDNVGGTILDMGLRRMRAGGRVIQCGTASVAEWSPPPHGLRNEREVLTRRLSWSGFIIFDHVARFPAAMATLAEWLSAGDIEGIEHVTNRIEDAPDAIRQLYAGENTGKRLIYIG